MTESGMSAPMPSHDDKERGARIREARRRKDMTQQELGDAVGVTKQMIWKLEKGEREVSDDWCARLAPHLGVVSAELMGDLKDVRAISPVDFALQPRRDLPVLGAAQGGDTMHFQDNGQLFEMAERPPALVGVPKAFGVYHVGESMLPRYEPGDLLYCNPNRPIRRGHYVVVELSDSRGIVKRFVSMDDDTLTLEQLNPPKTIKLDRRDVRRVVKIVGSRSDD